ncbi:hypothetical protein HNQ71_005705 [Mesorhizobium sangaii]|uniref:Uncharacterized protein n=1 Tax=Mesorhizobium sangaii TaxID=505389 RepID=A0A841PS80_9HYPH|nr:hypothetical protein [Mesorhizobium sangaii]
MPFETKILASSFSNPCFAFHPEHNFPVVYNVLPYPRPPRYADCGLTRRGFQAAATQARRNEIPRRGSGERRFPRRRSRPNDTTRSGHHRRKCGSQKGHGPGQRDTLRPPRSWIADVPGQGTFGWDCVWHRQPSCALRSAATG